MNKLEKLFNTIQSSPNTHLKKHATTELITQLQEYEAHIDYIIVHTYSLLASEHSDDRTNGSRIFSAIAGLINLTIPVFVLPVATDQGDVYLGSDGSQYAEQGASLNAQLSEIQRSLGVETRVAGTRLVTEQDLSAGIELRGRSARSSRLRLAKRRKSMAVSAEEAPLNVDDVFRLLEKNLRSPDWFKRHGAFLAFDALARSTRRKNIFAYTLPSALVAHTLEILQHDKFSDFLSDHAAAPVREAAASLLHALHKHLGNIRDEVFMRIKAFLGDADWQTQLSGLLSVKAIFNFMQPHEHEQVAALLTELLQAQDDDVRYGAAQLLLQCTALLDRERVVQLCWDDVRSSADIALSKTSVIFLLSRFYRADDSPVEALFPCFRSPLKDVRQAVLSLFLAAPTSQIADLCVENLFVEEDLDIVKLTMQLLGSVYALVDKKTELIMRYVRVVSRNLNDVYEKADFRDATAETDLHFSGSGILTLGEDVVMQGRVNFLEFLWKYVSPANLNLPKASRVTEAVFLNLCGCIKRLNASKSGESEDVKSDESEEVICKIQNIGDMDQLEKHQPLPKLGADFLKGVDYKEFKNFPTSEILKKVENPLYASHHQKSNFLFVELVRAKATASLKSGKLTPEILLLYHTDPSPSFLRFFTRLLIKVATFAQQEIIALHLMHTQPPGTLTFFTELGDIFFKMQAFEESKCMKTRIQFYRKVIQSFTQRDPLVFIYREVVDSLDLFSREVMSFFVADPRYNADVVRRILDILGGNYYVSRDNNSDNTGNNDTTSVSNDNSNDTFNNTTSVIDNTDDNPKVINHNDTSTVDNLKLINEGSTKVTLDDTTAIDYTDIKERAIEFLDTLIDIHDFSYNFLFVRPLLREIKLTGSRTASTVLSKLVATLQFTPTKEIPMYDKIIEEKNVLEQLYDPRRIPTLPLADIKVYLRPYQSEGVQWLHLLHTFGINGILADDMGLGKTIQVLAYLASVDWMEMFSLVVCPNSLIGHWMNEIEKVGVIEGICWRSQRHPATILGNHLSASSVINSNYATEKDNDGTKVNDPTKVNNTSNSTNGTNNSSSNNNNNNNNDNNSNNDNSSKKRIIVISYESFRSNYEILSAVKYFYLVIDEGHFLRNKETLVYKRLSSVPTENKILLTGTPVQNSVDDLFALINFLMPGYLGDDRYFHAYYMRPIMHGRDSRASEAEVQLMEDRLNELHKKVLPFILRRLKVDVLTDLPPKIIRDVCVEMSDKQRERYKCINDIRINEMVGGINTTDNNDSVVDNTDSCINTKDTTIDIKTSINTKDTPIDTVDNRDAAINTTGTKDNREDNKEVNNIQHLDYSNLKESGFLRIKEQLNICSMIDDPDNSCKFKALTDLINFFGGNDMPNKVLIFFQRKASANAVYQYLQKNFSLGILLLDGSVPSKNRQTLVDSFTKPSNQILLLTTQVGGLGLNLTAADTVIFFEHDWNPFNDLQAMDRAHRIGQKKSVNVFRLIAKDTLEEHVMSLQKFKMYVANSVVTQQNADVGKMDLSNLIEKFDS